MPDRYGETVEPDPPERDRDDPDYRQWVKSWFAHIRSQLENQEQPKR